MRCRLAKLVAFATGALIILVVSIFAAAQNA